MAPAGTDTVRITVNGEPREVPRGLTIDRLLAHLEIDPSRVAVERNLAIARRTDWGAIEVQAGDRLEIVWFVGGG
jgi:sulfur carrier protein